MQSEIVEASCSLILFARHVVESFYLISSKPSIHLSQITHMFVTVATAILMLLAGIGIFLVACQMMSSNLESASSEHLKALFSKMGKSKLLGVGIGALSTALIQSSGATTVMVIGFVNVGIMSLAQAATIIYGANIGTTITAQIVALGLSSGSGLSTTTIFAAMAGIGAFVCLFAKHDMWKKVGGIITGFGMLFVGLSMMSGSMEDFARLDAVKEFLATIGNPILLVLIGALFTAVIQSSSVMTSVAITMVVAELISLNQGIYITLGSNIGSCVVAIIAGMTSGKNAKRTALMHLIFNCLGVVVFMMAAGILYLTTSGSLDFGILFERMFPAAPQVQMAMFHTIFNCATVIIMLPLTSLLVNVVCRIIPDDIVKEQGESAKPHFFFVDEKMLRTPIIAVRQVKLEIEHMAAVAMHNYDIAIYTISSQDYSQVEEFNRNEEQLNYLNNFLVQYVVRLNSRPLNEIDHRYLSTTIRSIGDLERIGDYATNIIEYAEVLRDHKLAFPANLKEEIEQMREGVFSVYQSAMKAYMDINLDALEEANRYEELVDQLTEQMADRNVARLSNNEYNPVMGAEYLELASDSERIADHLINVGKTIRTLLRPESVDQF